MLSGIGIVRLCALMSALCCTMMMAAGQAVLVTDFDDDEFLEGTRVWSPKNYLVWNDRLYFTARTAEYGEELWSTDGTVEGTSPVADVQRTYISNPERPVPFDGALWFAAAPVGGHEDSRKLYRTEGTPDTTTLIQGIGLDDTFGGSEVSSLHAYDGSLYFAARDEFLRGIYKIDSGSTEAILIGTEMPAIFPFDQIHEDAWWRDKYLNAGIRSGYSGEERRGILQYSSDGIESLTDQYGITETSGLMVLGDRAWFRTHAPEYSYAYLDLETQDIEYVLPLQDSKSLDNVYAFDGSVVSDDNLFVPWSDGIYHIEGIYEDDGITSITKISDRSLNDARSINSGLALWKDGVAFFRRNEDLSVTLCTASKSEGETQIHSFFNGSKNFNAGGAGFSSALDRLWFFLGDQVWTSDGTTEGTIALGEAGPDIHGTSHAYRRHGSLNRQAYFAEFDGAVYFSGSSRMWRSDGTIQGTGLFTLPGTEEKGEHRILGVSGDYILLSHFDVKHPDLSRDNIWKSNSRNLVTSRVGEAGDPVSFNSILGSFVAENGKLITLYSRPFGKDYFLIWVTDPITSEIKELNVLTDSYCSSCKYFKWAFPIGESSVLFMMESSGSGSSLWMLDTEEGASLIKTFYDDTRNYLAVLAARLGDQVIFTAREDYSRDSFEPWISDGTIEGTRELIDLNEDNSHLVPSSYVSIGNEVWFSNGGKVYRTDGTEEGTVQVGDPISFFNHSNGQFFSRIEFQGYYTIMSSRESDGYVIVRANGAEDRIEDIATLGVGGDYEYSLWNWRVVAGNKLFFTFDDDISGRELWVSDGTQEGTRMVKDINPGPGFSDPSFLTPFGDFLYFTAYSPEYGTELWRSDGTEDGTEIVADLNEGELGSNPYYLTVAGEHLFFTATDGSNDYQLWAIDGTSVYRDTILKVPSSAELWHHYQ